MTIDIIELNQLLAELINDSTVDSKYQSRLIKLRASIDPSKRFNLDSKPQIWVQDESKPVATGTLENDSIAIAVDRLERGMYVGLRDAHLRTTSETTVEYKRPADSEGGHAD